MLHIAPISPATVASALRAPNGFCWWYLDLVDDDGNGIVLIWSYGLPFLPSDKTVKYPIDRPSVSVACYRAGQQCFYALQEYPPEVVHSDWATHWRFADTQIRFSEANGAGRLSVELDLAVPGSSERCTGLVEVSGTLCKTSCMGANEQNIVASPEVAPHVWSPRMVATPGHADVRWGGERLQVAGRAYYDGNASTVALDQLGIGRWRWGRLAFPERELIYYLVDPLGPQARASNVLVEVTRDGHMTLHQLTMLTADGERRCRYGPRYHQWLHLRTAQHDISVEMASLVEPGPFYLRFLTTARDALSGSSARGMSEVLLPQKVNISWQQPFVRMRAHAVGARNSMWLPLFNGPSKSRGSRLVRGILSRNAVQPPGDAVTSKNGLGVR